MSGFDPVKYKQTTECQWQEAAEAWHRWGSFLGTWLGPVTEEMLDMASVGPGARSLDVAAGAGEQTIAAAKRAGPTGYVLATDISSNILQFAAAEVKKHGLTNVECTRMDGEHLDVPASSFDVVMSRVGLIYFPDQHKALTGVHKALKPGGRVAAIVHGTADKNAFPARTNPSPARHHDAVNEGSISAMPTEYTARVLKLDLPEQDTLKNDAERCSADPGMLQAIGRGVGHQIRITRPDNPGFVALYTVAQANPPADAGRADVVRTGLLGRERLGTPGEMDAVVQATVVDDVPPPRGVRFFEVAEDDRTQAYFVAIAPHGGDIEKHTDDEAEQLARELVSNGCPATTWICRGFGDELKGASDRWHITSTDLHPASFPLLRRIATRTFCHGVAFHGFSKRPDDADVYIGGGASGTLKRAIRSALHAADLPLQIRIATESDDPKFQGRSADNLINRLATQGIHIEQSLKARKLGEKIAEAIATVYRSRIARGFVCLDEPPSVTVPR